MCICGIELLSTSGIFPRQPLTPYYCPPWPLLITLLPRPAAVYALAAGCLLHVFGSVADIVGPKQMWVTGSFLFIVFTVAVGRATTGLQIIMFRTCLGAAVAMCLPTTTSLITNTFARGAWRTTAFAMSGMAQPLGYALGLVLGGIFTDTIGWRWSYYIMAMINFGLSVVSVWSLPNIRHVQKKTWSRQLKEDVDWIVSRASFHRPRPTIRRV